MNFNKTIVVGRIGKDPELKAMPSGSSVCTFSLVTTRVWLKDGVKQDDTEWFNVVFYGKPAETIMQYVKKGSMLLVEGRMKTRTWDKDGVKHYRTELIGENFQLPPRGKSTDEAEEYQQQATPAKKTGPKHESVLPEYPAEEDINPEDIPF